MTQRYTSKMDFKHASKIWLLALFGASFALTAAAQWQWLDKDGRKVFSDRAPPAEIQEKSILKRPSGMPLRAAPVADGEVAAATAPTASAAASKPPPAKVQGKDAQLEAKKKKAEDEEQAAKKAEEEIQAKARADNCQRAQKGMVTLQSGIRLAVTNAKGEREVMDDAARAAESKRLQGIVDSDCKK